VSEIIIVDDSSTDRTLEVAKTLNFKNLRVFRRSLEGNFSSQRNFALSKAKNEWVFFVDADERVSDQMLGEIKQEIKDTDKVGYYIKRKDVLWGRVLLHGETGNIRFIRLVKKGGGRWRGRVHEYFDLKGKSGILNNELTHYPHQTVSEFLAEIGLYSSLRARELYEEGVRSSVISIILYTKGKFLLNYFAKLGLLDGTQGLIFAIMMSFHSFLVRSKLWLLDQK
jgi:glycosyltransferase involved in cell wall biosynthesis